MDVNGKKAIVIGGTSGIGLAAANELATLGADVVAISRRSRQEEEGGDSTIQFASCDIRDRDALAIELENQAPFDILVLTATGGDRVFGPFMDMELDAFQNSFDKLWGYATAVKLGVNHLAAEGCIVLVSGTPARRSKPGQVALGAVGAAVENFAKSVAQEIAPRRLNVVAPGIIETAIYGEENEQRKSLLTALTKRHTIPRAGNPMEVAKAILFVIENDFVTGTTVDVDGGWLLS